MAEKQRLDALSVSADELAAEKARKKETALKKKTDAAKDASDKLAAAVTFAAAHPLCTLIPWLVMMRTMMIAACFFLYYWCSYLCAREYVSVSACICVCVRVSSFDVQIAVLAA